LAENNVFKMTDFVLIVDGDVKPVPNRQFNLQNGAKNTASLVSVGQKGVTGLFL